MSEDVIILWDKFNREADIPKMLKSHGWTEFRRRGDRVDFIRPGKKADGGISANWHTAKRLFYVFTTNTEFDADRAYNPVQVFAALECNGSMRDAARKLIELGYCVARELKIIGKVKLI